MIDDTILTRFLDDVLQTGPEATLPANLCAYWLTELQENLMRYFVSVGTEAVEGEDHMSLPLAAVLHILFAKNHADAIETTLDDVYQLFIDYRLELAFEELRRTTRINALPATVESIFTPSRRNMLLSLGGR